ncbi:hypothetical protein AAC387_Pa07g2116 [Persea americana]
MKWVLTNKYSMPDNDKTSMHMGTENCAQHQLTFQVQAIGWGHRRGITGSLDCECLWGVTRFNVVPQTFRLHCTCGLSLLLPYQLKMAIHKYDQGHADKGQTKDYHWPFATALDLGLFACGSGMPPQSTIG